jgi:hypothetical protein
VASLIIGHSISAAILSSLRRFSRSSRSQFVDCVACTIAPFSISSLLCGSAILLPFDFLVLPGAEPHRTDGFFGPRAFKAPLRWPQCTLCIGAGL